MGPGDHTLLIRLGGKHLYLLSYLAVPLLRMQSRTPQYVLLHNCVIGILKLYLRVLVLCLHVCLYITRMSGANVGSLRWKLQIVIFHVGAGN